MPGAHSHERARVTYDAASDHYDEPPLAFWNRAGQATVVRLRLRPGERVLDAACGAGASAIPAAQAVGPRGAVLGVDLSARLLDRAAAKARSLGLANIEWRCADMTALGLPGASFDAVTCVFGVFFVDDMPGLVREFWRMLRSGGRVGVTTWGPRFVEPVYSVWRDAVKRERPDLHSAFNPWDRISDPVAVARLFEDAGIDSHRVRIEAVADTQPLRTPDDWWTIALGSGCRWTIDNLGAAAERVRAATTDFARRHDVRAVETNMIFATAAK